MKKLLMSIGVLAIAGGAGVGAYEANNFHSMVQNNNITPINPDGNQLTQNQKDFVNTMNIFGQNLFSLITPSTNKDDQQVNIIKQITDQLATPIKAIKDFLKNFTSSSYANKMLGTFQFSMPSIGEDGKIDSQLISFVENGIYELVKLSQPSFNPDAVISFQLSGTKVLDNVKISTTVRSLVEGLAPDLIHFINFMVERATNGENNFSLLMTQYFASVRGQDGIKDGFDKINNFGGSTSQPVTNFENLVFDLLGKDDSGAGWKAENGNSLTRATLNVTYRDKAVSFDAIQAMLASINGIIPIGSSIHYAYDNLFAHFLKIDDTKHFNMIDSDFVPSVDLSMMWKIAMQSQLSKQGEYNFWHDSISFGNISSVFEVYNYQGNNKWIDVDNSATDKNEKYSFTMLTDTKITNWSLKGHFDTVTVTHNGEQHVYKNQDIVLPMY